MGNFKRASISVVVVLGIGILVMSFNRQPDAIGVGASTPVDSTEMNNNRELTQTNARLNDVENNINQITATQQTMLNSLQELVKLSKQDKQATTATDKPQNNQSQSEIVEPVLPTAQQIEEQKVKDNALFAEKENYFYSEPVDDGWRSNEESRLNSIFEENQLNANSLECRGSSCRLEIATVNQTEANDAMDKLILAMPNSEGNFIQEVHADGSYTTTLIIKPASN